jgi:small subunit ribosomal protein S8
VLYTIFNIQHTKMDSVGDALIRIKNGYLAGKPQVDLSYSKLNLAIVKVLEKEGFVSKSEEGKSPKNENIKQIQVTLKYENRRPAVQDLKRISKPGLRVYKGKKSLPWVLNGLGIALVSTPKGVMTDKEARKAGLGGEVLAYVW